jgi:hypothetical protein
MGSAATPAAAGATTARPARPRRLSPPAAVEPSHPRSDPILYRPTAAIHRLDPTPHRSSAAIHRPEPTNHRPGRAIPHPATALRPAPERLARAGFLPAPPSREEAPDR